METASTLAFGFVNCHVVLGTLFYLIEPLQQISEMHIILHFLLLRKLGFTKLTWSFVVVQLIKNLRATQET